MTPEEMRVAIEKVCPNRICGVPVWQFYNGTVWNICLNGDLLDDLNAMQSAMQYASEHLMDADQWEKFGKELESQHTTACLKAADADEVDYHDFATLMTELTAAQIAEAFLKAVGKWKD